MAASSPKRRSLPAGAMLSQRKLDLPALLDKSIQPLGTCSLVAGIGALAAGISPASDYLLAGGVLLHLAVQFEKWWKNH